MDNTSSTNRFHALSLLTAAGFCAVSVYAANKLRSQMKKNFDPRGKVILITGGSRGFGLALAEELGARGARLALAARDEAELDRACSELSTHGIEAHAFPGDITKTSAATLIRAVVAHFGHLDVLLNNAGAITVGSFDSFSQEDFEEAMDLMFWAPVHLMRAALSEFEKRGSGQIINITSIGGRVSVPHLMPYCCAKFALYGFSTGLAIEAKQKAVHVLTVAPGLMRTGSYLNAGFKGSAKDEFAWFGLLGNLPGFSVSAKTAARDVAEALEAQRYTCTISLPAKLLVALEALAPETSLFIMENVERALLPQGGNASKMSGKNLNSKLGSLFQGLTTLGRLAAARFNE